MILFLVIIFSTALNSSEMYEMNCDRSLLELSEQIAVLEEGKYESGINGGYVTKYLGSVGLKSGNPYCAAGQYSAFLDAAKALGISVENIPFPKTGLANAVFKHFKRYGSRVPFNAKRHSFMIWRKGRTVFGHIERIIKTHRAGWVETIAYNVTFIDKSGIKREGVAVKKRNIFHPLGRMQLRGIASLKGV